MHEMEGAVEARGRAAFPGLDVVSGDLVSGTGADAVGRLGGLLSGMCVVWRVRHALELPD